MTFHKPKLLFPMFLFILITGCQNLPLRESVSKENQVELEQQADLAYSQKDFDAALPLYQQLTESDPSNALKWFRLGNIYAQKNQPTKAINTYRQAVINNPRFAIAWHNMGVLQLRMTADTWTNMANSIGAEDPLYPRAKKISEATLEILGVTQPKTSNE